MLCPPPRRLGDDPHVVPVSERGRWDMAEVRTGSPVEHHDHTGNNCHQQPSKRPERGDPRLRFPGRERLVHLPRVHAELVSGPVPHAVHTGHVRLSYVFLQKAR